jgi:transcriptional regulator with XRE-family HTH domain
MSEEEFLISLGKRIKIARAEKNIKQAELASMCNFEKASMSRLEAGKANPTILTLLKVSKALDLPVSFFFFYHT